jgi:hypothetical protein
MTTIRWFLLMAALLAAPVTVCAAEPTYPPGSRIGLVPPEGMVTSKSFFGFEDADNNVAIIMVSFPPEAYAELEKTVSADALKRQNVALEKREALTLPSGKAFLVVGRLTAEKPPVRKWILVASTPQLTALVTMQVPDAAKARYSDAGIRAALASLAVRATVPVEEQLSLLPFQVSELAGFKVAGVLPGRALMLSDATVEQASKSPVAAGLEPHMYVTIAPGGPAQPSERDTFAREAFATVANLKEVHITTSEPLRLANQQSHQIIAEARDATGATPLTVVQWLRFGGGGFLQMVGISRTEGWKDSYPRFRQVRDGIEAK